MELADAVAFAKEHRFGVLVTLKGDGHPQLSNISYFVGEDGALRISITEGRAKTANLRRDPWAAVHVARSDFYGYVVLEGTAELSPVAADPNDATADALVEYYRALTGEHPDWNDYRATMVRDRRLLATFRPSRAYGMLPG